MKVDFDGEIKLEFHGAKVTSNGGLLAYRDLDYALGLFDSVSAVFTDKRTARNIQHDIPALLRQSIYSRLAGYEDVNNAEQSSIDPVKQAFRLQSGETSVIRSGIQSGKFSFFRTKKFVSVKKMYIGITME